MLFSYMLTIIDNHISYGMFVHIACGPVPQGLSIRLIVIICGFESNLVQIIPYYVVIMMLTNYFKLITITFRC